MTVRSLYVAATGMTSAQRNVDNISHNLANANTTGFKRGLINFEDLMYQNEAVPGAVNSSAGTDLPSGIQFGLGSKVGSLYKSFEQGSFESTPGVALNIALDGKGFIQVTLPTGEIAYTRDGALQLNSTGQLVNSQGYEISPGIQIPDDATNITITPDGRVQGDVNFVLTEFGQIELARFINNSGLQAIGNNLYIESEASGAPIAGLATDPGFATINQFYLESSNVNSLFEITELVKAQRAFEFNSKVMQTSEQMLKTMVDTKSVIRLIITLLVLPFICNAQSIKADIEEQIANEVGYENVVLIMPIGTQILDSYTLKDLEITGKHKVSLKF